MDQSLIGSLGPAAWLAAAGAMSEQFNFLKEVERVSIPAVDVLRLLNVVCLQRERFDILKV